MSKTIGFHSALRRSWTSGRKAYRYLGAGIAGCVAGIALQPQAASAQFWNYGPWHGGWAPGPGDAYQRPYSPYSRGYDDEGPLRPGEVADLVRRRGWTLLSGVSRSGDHYVANVRNGYGQRLFVVLDAYDGRVLRTRALDDRPDTGSLAAIPGGAGGSLPDDGIRPVGPGGSSPTPAPKPKPKPVVKRVAPPATVKREPLAPPPGASPDNKGGGIAVVKPAVEPPATRPPSPTPVPAAPSPSAALTPSDAPATPDGTAPKVPVPSVSPMAKPAAPPPAPDAAPSAPSAALTPPESASPDAAPKPVGPKGGKISEPSSGDSGHASPTVRQVYPGGGQGEPAPTPPAVEAPKVPAASAEAAPPSPAVPSQAPKPTPSPKPADKGSLPPDAGFE